MHVLPVYRAKLEPLWIDYNGHLRDAYFGLIFSLAIDELMDYLGLDAAYRARTRCTLYTLEMHLHYSREVKFTDDLSLATSILDADVKRIHAGCRFTCAGADNAAATAEAMLLHVYQGEPPAAAPFPIAVVSRLDKLKLSSEARAGWTPESRKIQIRR